MRSHLSGNFHGTGNYKEISDAHVFHSGRGINAQYFTMMCRYYSSVTYSR